MLKALIRSLLHRRGLELKPIGEPVRGSDNYIHRLKVKGFRPGTVIDIGVANGTPWLYQFPEAKLVLIEPDPEFGLELERISAEHQADILPYAAGVDAGLLSLDVDHRAASGSSLPDMPNEKPSYWKIRGQDRPTGTRQVDVRPLDLMIGERYRQPFLIKIDTEGFELEVLKGAIKTLAKAEYLIVETSVARRHEGSYAFADLVAFLAENGFGFSDILDVQNFNSDGDISYMNLAFARTEPVASAHRSSPSSISHSDDAAA